MLGITAQILDGVDIRITTERCTVGGTVALIRATVSLTGTLTHHTVTDNQTRTLLLCLCLSNGLTDLNDIVTVDLLYIPSPCLVFLGGVLTGHHLRTGRELDVIGVIEHDEVVKTQVTGNTSGSL